MLPLEKIGVVSSLPKIELAKLVGETEEVHLSAGQTLLADQHVFFVAAGELELQYVNSETQDVLTIRRLGAGEMLGEWALLPDCTDIPVVVAIVDSAVYKLPAERWLLVTQQHADVNSSFQRLMLNRLHDSQRMMAKFSRYAATYAQELWRGPDSGLELPNADPTPAEVAASRAALEESAIDPAGAPVQRTESGSQKQPPSSNSRSPIASWLTWGFSFLCAVALIFVWLMPNLPGKEPITVSLILIWTVVNWYTGLLPDYAVALFACATPVVLGVMTSSEAFQGFADPAWFLLLGSFGIGAAIQRSGLLYRIALHLLRTLPPTYTGQAMALALSGLVLTPCLPAVQSRITIAGMLSLELSEAMRFKPGSKGAAGLAMSAFLGFGQMRYLFLNGSSYSLLAWGLLPLAVRHTAGWSHWFWAALPLGFVAYVCTLWITIGWIFHERGVIVSRTIIHRQLAILGKMTTRERVTLWVTLGVVSGFLLQPWHQVDPSWIALGGMLILAMLKVVDKDVILTKIDWQYMLFYGTLTGVVAMINRSGISQLLIGKATAYLAPVLNTPLSFLLVATVVTLLLRLLFQPAPAILFMALSFYPLSANLGFSPLLVAVVVVAATTSWLVPQLLSSYTTFYTSTQGKCFTHQQVRPLSVIYAVILLVAVAGSVPYWKLVGLIGAP